MEVDPVIIRRALSRFHVVKEEGRKKNQAQGLRGEGSLIPNEIDWHPVASFVGNIVASIVAERAGADGTDELIVNCVITQCRKLVEHTLELEWTPSVQCTIEALVYSAIEVTGNSTVRNITGSCCFNW